MQSLAEDAGAQGGDAAAPALPWGAESRGSKQGLAAGQGRAPGSGPGILGPAPRQRFCLQSRGGTGSAWQHGHCRPRGLSRLPRTWVFPTFLPGFISWGLASFPAQEEHVKKPSVN